MLGRGADLKASTALSKSHLHRNDYQNLSFYDVEIDMGGYKISTDALSTVNKKLTLAPIKITNANGELVKTYIRD